MTKADRERTLWLGTAKEIAHQMGTPLSAIMGWLELLPTTKDRAAIVREIDHNLERLKHLLERLEQIGPTTRMEAISIAEIVQDVMSFFRMRLPADDQRIILKDEVDGKPIIRGNRELLTWALENLVRNSIDALPKNEGTVIVRAFLENSRVIIDVADNGEGISAKDRNRIFKPGFTTRRGRQGTGLSLAKYVIQDILEGELFVKASRLHQGTTMRIVLENSLAAKSRRA